MIAYLCETCGTQYEASEQPPSCCPICLDERQYVGWQGQRWLRMDELAARHRLRIGLDAGLLAIGIEGSFAIPQRALLLPTDAGNILWECISLVTDEAVAALRAAGGVDRIIISHPHFYSAMVAWSEALGGVPILLHGADRGFIQRDSARIEHWQGDQLRLSAEVTLIRCGGHFEGSTALHWRRPGAAGPALFPADAMQVALDRRHVAFLYSYPNMMPMRPEAVHAMQSRLAPFDFEQLYGFSWDRNILGDARAAVDRSFVRYFQALAAAA